MSQMPSEESPLADHNFVNVGEQNWYALRSKWREVGEDFDESKVVRVDPATCDMEIVYSSLLKNTGTFRIPLSVAVATLTEVWEQNPQ